MNLVVNSLLLHYRATGKPGAPVVLMLHGWGATAASLDGLATALAPHYRVIQLDLPGFGGSEVPPETWHVADYAQLIRDFVAKAKLTPLHAVIGHSFGGRIAIKALGTGLLAPNRLVLMGSAGVAHHQSTRNQIFKAVAKTGKAVTALPGLGRLRHGLRQRLYQSAGSTDYLEAGPLRQVFINTIREDLQANAANIKRPTLLVWGALDAETPLVDGQTLAAKIPHAQLKTVDHAGHYVFLDAPDVVAHDITEFLG